MMLLTSSSFPSASSRRLVPLPWVLLPSLSPLGGRRLMLSVLREERTEPEDEEESETFPGSSWGAGLRLAMTFVSEDAELPTMASSWKRTVRGRWPSLLSLPGLARLLVERDLRMAGRKSSKSTLVLLS